MTAFTTRITAALAALFIATTSIGAIVQVPQDQPAIAAAPSAALA